MKNNTASSVPCHMGGGLQGCKGRLADAACDAESADVGFGLLRLASASTAPAPAADGRDQPVLVVV